MNIQSHLSHSTRLKWHWRLAFIIVLLISMAISQPALAAMAWTTVAPMSTARSSHTATILLNGKVLVTGGSIWAYLARAEVYDPEANTWTTVASINTPCRGYTATLLPNGKVLIAGGENMNNSGDTIFARAEVYDPEANTWTTVAPMNTARSAHTAMLLLNGKVLVAGGFGDGSGNSAEVYDPEANTWMTVAPMNAARVGHTSTLLLNGKVLVAGGIDSGKSAEVYNPEANTWTTVAPMNTGRYEHTATLLPNGKVLVAGGYINTGILASAEVYDPEANTWTTAAPMNTARYRHTATLLPNGEVLVAGGAEGYNNTPILASAEIYDPEANTWTTVAPMNTARFVHTATLLPNGMVLVAGGDGDHGILASAEIYATPDDSLPTLGNFFINNGDLYSNSIHVTLEISASDPNGVAQMRFSNDETTWSTWQAYSTSTSWSLSTGDGLKTVYTMVKDVSGNISAIAFNTITLDTVAPAGSVLIAGDANYTATTSVDLTLSANDDRSGVAKMSFSNNGSTWSAWESYATSRAWIINSGDGSKTVYARYQDNAGNISTSATDTITLDTTPPTASVKALGTYQAKATFTVSWSGTDALSGLANYDVQSRDGASGTWTDWETATTSISAIFTGQDNHTYAFRVRARDDVGNVSSYSSIDTQTTVDVTAPNPGNLTINGGALTTTSINVILSLSATDITSGVAMMRLSNTNSPWSAWQPYATQTSWPLLSGDGAKTVHAEFRDRAGNNSSSVLTTIVLDTTVDTEYGFTINAGAMFTNQTSVTLTIGAKPGTAHMEISNDGGFGGAVWEPYNSHKAWTITQSGSYFIPRVVYTRYKDVNGVVSSNYQDDVMLDVTPPTGIVSIVNATGLTVTLELSATDDVSGVGQMLISNLTDLSDGVWESYTTSRAWVLGNNRPVYVRFKDNAGNVSATYSASLNWNIFLPFISK